MIVPWLGLLLACPSPDEHYEGVVVGNPGDAKIRWADLLQGPASRAKGVVDRLDLVGCAGPEVQIVELGREVSIDVELELVLPVGQWCRIELWWTGSVEVEDAELDPRFTQLYALSEDGLGIDEGAVVLELAYPGWAGETDLAAESAWPLLADRLRLGSSLSDEGGAVTGAGTVHGPLTASAPTFVLAVGDEASARSSPDGGETWEGGALGLDPTLELRAVAPGTGRAVALGVEGTSLLTTDSSLTAAGTAPPGLFDLAWGPERFAAVGVAGSAAWSWDGLSWNAVVTGETEDLVAVAGTDGGFLAVTEPGTVLASDDGASWEVVGDIGASIADLALAPGGLVAVGEGAWTSADGTSWTSLPEADGVELAAVVATDTGSVAVGDGVAMVLDEAGVASLVTTGVSGLVDVTWTGETLVALGPGDALYQARVPDDWTLRDGDPEGLPALRSLAAAPVER